MNDTINKNNAQSAHNSTQNTSSRSIADMLVEDTEPLTDYLLDNPDFVSLEELKDKELSQTDIDLDNPSPANLDSESAAGHARGQDIDDDVVATAQTMGIGLDDDEENPAELNIAEAVERAEKEHWEN